MDVVRTRRRSLRLGLIAPVGLGAVVLGVATYAVPSLLRGTVTTPHVGRDALVVDTVREETLVRSVRAPGELVADRVHVVSANIDGSIASVNVRAGSAVDASSVIATASNPDLDAIVEDARAQLAAANADLASASAEASAAHLDQIGAYRSARATAEIARNEMRADDGLLRSGYISTLTARQATIKAGDAREQSEIASRQIAVGDVTARAKRAVKQAAVDRARAALDADRARVDTLVVRAGSAGIVQSVAAEPGQRIASGGEIARVAAPADLEAVLHVAEGDMRGIVPGLHARLETNGAGILRGRVVRIAPVAVDGDVAVDVALDDPHGGLRPAQTVDGTIELFTLPRARTIARPVGAQDGATIDVFRLSADATHAFRTRVRLGAGSLDRVEIRSGLPVGTNVVVSDTSAFANDSELVVTAH